MNKTKNGFVPASANLGKLEAAGSVHEILAKHWDVIVVGAGHNGLSCAAYLARAGKSVLVLEARERVGVPARCTKFGQGIESRPALISPDSCTRW